MLLSTCQSSPHSFSLTWLSIAAVVVACLLTTFHHPVAQAQAQQGQPDTKRNGRIYVSVSFRQKTEGQEQQNPLVNWIVAVDPASGKWQMIVENGQDARVSPDRRTLVFSRFNDGIWKCEADGQFPIKISDSSGRPVWSPDGKYLVVTKGELIKKDSDKPRTARAWKDETWRIDGDGRNPIKLPIPDTDTVEDWSPDGQWFVTSSDRHPPYGSGYQLYLMKVDGTQERRLTESGLNVYARFSPDGKKILYVHQTAKAGNSIWTVDLDGNNAMEIAKEVGLATPDGAFWSPDGKQIAVCMFNWELDENGKKVSRGGADTADHRIEIMDADGTNRRRVNLQGAAFTWMGSLGDWR